MDATTELTRLSGLQQLQAIFAGKTGYAGIVKTLDLHPVSAEEGLVVFEGSPTQAVYESARLRAWRLCGDLARYRHGLRRALTDRVDPPVRRVASFPLADVRPLPRASSAIRVAICAPPRRRRAGHSKIGWSMSAMGRNVILGVIKRDRVNVVARQQGRHGGVGLRRPASRITLGQIYKAVESESGVFAMRSQVHEGCMVVCAMERRLGPIFNAAKDAVEQALSKTSLAELVRGVG